MKAQVRYLTRLARQGAGPPVLQPPRPLFTGGNHPQPLEPVSVERTAGPADTGPGRSRLSPAPGRGPGGSGAVEAPGALTAAGAPDAGTLMPRASRTGSRAALEAPARADAPGPQAARREPDPLSPARPTRFVLDAEPADPPSVWPPSDQPPSDRPPSGRPSSDRPSSGRPGDLPASGPGPAETSVRGPAAPPEPDATTGSPESWNDPMWGTPVELPTTVPQLPSPAHAGGQLPADAVAGTDDVPLLPAYPRSAPRSESPRQAQLSIGTIEVTVVPAAKPSGAELPPARPAVRSRPASLIAAGPGADRLRDGRRRWYGIAQG